jgi:DNA-binding NarL/FixJ family response regulator
MPPNTTIKIAIADDHQVFREGLSFIISKNRNFDILFDASNGKELLEKLGLYKPEVILLDIKMPIIDGFEATQAIKELYPHIKIIILTMHDNDEFILHLLEMGVNSYLLKNSSSSQVIHAIETVIDKEYFFDERTCQVMLRGLHRKKMFKPKNRKVEKDIQLTQREYEVLRLILYEYSTNEIAEKLILSMRTVETHRKNLFTKFGVKSIVGLVIKAIHLGFFEPLEDNNKE